MPPSAPPTATVSRLPSRPSARTERRRELRSAVLAVLGLLVVLVGVPVALALSVGNPLPSTAPTRDWLIQEVTAGTVLAVLACGLWLAWAHFAVCVLAEWRAARRGSGVPSDVPLGGGSQQVARRLVAAALLLAGAATLVPSGGAAAPVADRSTVSISAVQDVAPAVSTPAPAVAETASPVVKGPELTYVVAPPDGRRYDSLWDIAERTLGDPFRYKEVFELNRDRIQDDGRKLVDANLIHPGWVLRMPADASGPGVSTPALAPPQRQAPAAPAAPAAPEAPTAVVTAGSAVTSATTQAAPAPETGTSVERLLLGGGLLAAGVAAALSSRRGPYGRPSEPAVEEQLRLAATPGRADLLDRALRGLSAASTATRRPLPEIAVAYLDDAGVTLSLVGTAGEPPAPWTTVGEGRGWTVKAADVPAEAPDVAAPYPALVGLATTDGVDVLVDLEAAPGLLALEGDLDVAREVAASLVVELATNLWSDGVLVTAVGFADDLTPADPDAVSTADTLDQVLSSLEAEHKAGQQALRALGVDGVLSGRLARGADRRRPRVVVLSGPPTPQEADRLQALVSGGRTPLAVVAVGSTPAARWRFAVDTAGTIDLGVLGVRATARRLPRAGYLALLGLLSGADDDRTTSTASIAALTPRAALEELTGAGAAAPLPTSDAGAALPVPMPRGLPAAEVRLLGPVEVLAPGPVDPAQRPLLTELVVTTALHRHVGAGGLHEAVLRAEVWPRGVSDDVLAATLRAAQAWLGTGADGQPRLDQDAAGRWVLTDDVHCDYDVLLACAATPDGPGEREALEHALSRVTGRAFSGGARDRVSLAFQRAARDARVVGTAVARRAAGLAAGAGDPAAAERSLCAGLALVPAAEPLWRDLLRLVADSPGRPQEVASAAYAALADAGLKPEAETDALVAQLAPSSSGARLG